MVCWKPFSHSFKGKIALIKSSIRIIFCSSSRNAISQEVRYDA